MELTSEEKQKIKSTFLKLKERNKEDFMFEILKNCGDVATIEKVMNYINDQCYPNEDIYSSIMEKVKDFDQRSWAIEHFKQGFGYQFKKTFGLNSCWITWTEKHVVPLAFCLKAIVSIHIDFIKDIVIYLAFARYNELILVST